MRSESDFLSDLGLLAFVTRLKRLSDNMLHDGRRLYKHLGMDIEPNWYVIFKLLEHQGPFTVTEIADRLGFAHPSVISIVNRMIDAGYLEESRFGSDNRKRYLKLTEKAVEAMPRYEEIWKAGAAGLKRMLDDIDAEAFLGVIEERVAQKGFMNRALEELELCGQVEIEAYSDLRSADFARLNYAWISEYFEIEDEDRKVLDDPRSYIIDRGGEIFFALRDGEACGTAAMISNGDGSFELAKMAVDAKFRGLKIGERLMLACIDHARASGARTVNLLSNTKLIPAIRLYRKFGFKEVPLDPATPYKRSNIMMELKLGATR